MRERERERERRERQREKETEQRQNRDRDRETEREHLPSFSVMIEWNLGKNEKLTFQDALKIHFQRFFVLN